MKDKHLEFLKVYAYPRKFRLGVPYDGGYVVADLSGGYDCYVSAGVGREESFSRDFIERYGMHELNSFGIDSSIEAYPSEFTNNISYIKKNLSATNDNSNTNLKYLFTIYKNIFLKIDIEAGEYGWLNSLTQEDLRHFKQIVIEVHGVNNDSWGVPYEEKCKALQALSKTHWLVHAHGNNARYMTNYIPNVFELTYIRKSEVVGVPPLNTEPLPVAGLDFPNNVNRPDHMLNRKPFVN